MENKLDILFEKIKNECIEIIEKRNIYLEQLSLELGCETKTLINLLKSRSADFSVYLKLYDILLEW